MTKEKEEYMRETVTFEQIKGFFTPKCIKSSSIMASLGIGRVVGLSPEQHRDLILGASKHLSVKRPNEVEAGNGKLKLSQETLDILKKVGGAIARFLAFPERIRFPDTKPERVSLGRLLVESQNDYGGDIRFIAPVCPDYGKGDRFYRTMGGGISPEAQAAIVTTEVIVNSLPKEGFTPTIDLLVANTEDDKPEVVENCVSGDADKYEQSCQLSALAIRERLAGLKGVSVYTFKQFLGDCFRDRQYAYEAVIRELMERDCRFRELVEKVSYSRKDRHAQILGREESGDELAIRYMAQYAGLGSLVRRYREPVVLLNYATPNRAYYNPANVHRGLALSEADLKVIPVMGTIAKRG